MGGSWGPLGRLLGGLGRGFWGVSWEVLLALGRSGVDFGSTLVTKRLLDVFLSIFAPFFYCFFGTLCCTFFLQLPSPVYKKILIFICVFSSEIDIALFCARRSSDLFLLIVR